MKWEEEAYIRKDENGRIITLVRQIDSITFGSLLFRLLS